MDDYLSKPVRLADLQAMMEKWLPIDAEPRPALPVPHHTFGDHQAPVDVSVLEALVGDDPELIREFLRDFLISAGKAAVELRHACMDGIAAKASAEAHKLKSSAHSVGAQALGELCAELEASGNSGRLAELAALLPRFEAEMARVEAYLGRWSGQSPA